MQNGSVTRLDLSKLEKPQLEKPNTSTVGQISTKTNPSMGLVMPQEDMTETDQLSFATDSETHLDQTLKQPQSNQSSKN